jgi:hypothetical protein
MDYIMTNKRERFKRAQRTLALLDSDKTGKTSVAISLHPQTKEEYDYIRETLMEAGLTSGWVHNSDAHYKSLRGLGEFVEHDLTVFVP